MRLFRWRTIGLAVCVPATLLSVLIALAALPSAFYPKTKDCVHFPENSPSVGNQTDLFPWPTGVCYQSDGQRIEESASPLLLLPLLPLLTGISLAATDPRSRARGTAEHRSRRIPARRS